MNTSIIRLNIRSELKLQHRVSTLHLTSSLSFLFHFSSGLFPPFSFSAPSFYLLSLITPDLLLLISPSLSPASLFSLSFSEHDFFSLLFRLSVLCFDSLSLPLSLSVSSPLADERAECFLLPPEQMKMKVWSVCWRRYRGNVSPVCSPSTPNEQLLTRKHLFRKKNTTNESTHTHTQRKPRNEHKQSYNQERHTDGHNQKTHTHTELPVFLAGSRRIFNPHHAAGIDIRASLSPSISRRERRWEEGRIIYNKGGAVGLWTPERIEVISPSTDVTANIQRLSGARAETETETRSSSCSDFSSSCLCHFPTLFPLHLCFIC